MGILIYTRLKVPRDVEYHDTWNATRREVPLDVKCHETCHIHSDSHGLVAKHKEIHEIIALT